MDSFHIFSSSHVTLQCFVDRHMDRQEDPEVELLLAAVGPPGAVLVLVLQLEAQQFRKSLAFGVEIQSICSKICSKTSQET